MHILLIAVQEVGDDSNFFVPPFGLSSIATVLKKNGFNVELLHFNISEKKWHDSLQIIKKKNYDILGIGGMLHSYRFIKTLTEISRKENPKATIIIGGPIASVTEILLNATKCDIVVKGEGELTMLELAFHFSKGKDWHFIAGIAFKDLNGDVRMTSSRSPIKDLSTIHILDEDFVQYKQYIKPLPYPIRWTQYSCFKRSLFLPITRGCPNVCSFCYRHITSKVRAVQVVPLFDYLQNLIEKHSPDSLCIVTETLNYSTEYLLSFCKEKINRGIHLPMHVMGCRLNNLNSHSLESLANANCVLLDVGLESGSPKILKAMDKNIYLSQAAKAIKKIKDYGIYPHIYLIYGYPGESSKTVDETIDFCLKNQIDDATINFAIAFPKTKFFKLVSEEIYKQFSTLEDYVLYLSSNKPEYLNFTEMPYNLWYHNYKKLTSIASLKRGVDMISSNEIYSSEENTDCKISLPLDELVPSEFVRILSSPQCTIVYNTLYGGLIHLTKGMKTALGMGKKSTPPSNRDVAELLSRRLLVSKSSNERNVFRNEIVRRKQKAMAGKLIHQLQLNVSGICNFRCSYCYAKKNEDKYKIKSSLTRYTPTRMPVELACNAATSFLKFVRSRGTTSVGIGYFGREPFLAWEPIEAVLRNIGDGSKYGVEVSHYIITNASIIKENQRQILADNNVTVKVGLDGPHDAHNRVRVDTKGVGTYDKVFQEIEKLKRSGIRVIIASVLGKDNIETFDESFISIASSLGVDQVLVSLQTHSDFFELYSSDQIVEVLWKLWSKGKLIGVDVGGYWAQPGVRAFTHWSSLAEQMTCLGCGVSVYPNSEIYPCSHRVTSLGNSFNFDTLVSSDTYISQALRVPGNIKQCQGCAIEGFCVGICVAHQEFKTGNIYEIDPTPCKTLCKIADKIINSLADNSISEYVKNKMIEIVQNKTYRQKLLSEEPRLLDGMTLWESITTYEIAKRMDENQSKGET